MLAAAPAAADAALTPAMLLDTLLVPPTASLTKSAAAADVRLVLTGDLSLVGDSCRWAVASPLFFLLGLRSFFRFLKRLKDFVLFDVVIEAVVRHQGVERAFIEAVFLELGGVPILPERFADMLDRLERSEDR